MWPEDEAGLSEPVAAHKTQSRQTHKKKKKKKKKRGNEINHTSGKQKKPRVKRLMETVMLQEWGGRSWLTFDFLPVGSLCHELYVLHLFLLCFLHIFGCAALCSLAQHGQP